MLLALAALIAAVAPVGFHGSPRLAPAASFVAGKPVTVWCADTQYDWNGYLDSVYGNHDTVSGSTYPGSSDERLSPEVCATLTPAAKATKPVAPTARLGAAILVVTHESIHARGEADEGVTDCAAFHEMPRVAVKFFHVRSGKDLRRLMSYVVAYRSTSAPQFRTGC
jgi:hypothetical protein